MKINSFNTSLVAFALLTEIVSTVHFFYQDSSAHAVPATAKKTPASAKTATVSPQKTGSPGKTPMGSTTPVSKPGSISNPLDATTSKEEFGKLPTNINSDTLVLHSEDRVFIYKGNVVVTQGDMTLVSKVLEGTYNEQNQIEKMVAKGEVVITKQEIEATCQKALYNAVENTVTLTENPQLKQKDSVLTADRIKVFLADNRSEAEGNVRVTLIKPENGNIGMNFGATPTPKSTEIATPKFSTVNEPPKRDLPTPAPTRTPVPTKPTAETANDGE